MTATPITRIILGTRKSRPLHHFWQITSKTGRNLNFSEWGTYETRRKRKKLDEVCEQITTKEMPLPSYLWIHRDAKLSDEDIKTLCDWAKAERARLENSEAK